MSMSLPPASPSLAGTDSLGRVVVAESASKFSRGHHEIVASPCTIAPTGETLVWVIKQAVNLRMAIESIYSCCLIETGGRKAA
jgi:hypothetical protein